MVHIVARFRVNSPAVIHQTFESEAVIVNLETGDYFSLRGSGAEVWEAIVRGVPEEEIVAGLAGEGGAGNGRGGVGDDVHGLFVELLREALIVPVEAGAIAAGAGVRQIARRRPYERPILEKFTDMRELLLLDPIHELDEMGWPRPAGEEMAGER